MKYLRERVRCTSLVDWPVYPRLRRTMQGQSVGARLRGAMAHSGPRKAAEGGRPVLGMVESPGERPWPQPGTSHIHRRMIRIAITPAAFEAIAATMPSNVGVQQERAPNGDHYVWLDPRFVDRVRAMRGPGESYSDVILRVAKA